jgi:nucleotide-binding universal stress UspA family protein
MQPLPTTAALFGAKATPAASGCRRILIPIDASTTSRWAVVTGGQLAEELSARVTLLHVVVPPIALPSELAMLPDELDALRERGIRLLASASKSLPAEVRWDVSLREGAPAAVIAECARELGADLIVMGTRGMGRIARLLLGSTAEAVIRTATCPVVTVSHAPAIADVDVSRDLTTVAHVPGAPAAPL